MKRSSSSSFRTNGGPPGETVSFLRNYPISAPDLNLSFLDTWQLRTVWDLDPGFDYAILADDRQRKMPGPNDLNPAVTANTSIPEARVLTQPKDPAFKGEINDKYHYSADVK